MSKKRASISDRSPLNDFLSEPVAAPEKRPEAPQAAQATGPQQETENELERTTLYLRPDQTGELDRLKIELRKHKVRTNRSEIVRVAIDLLTQQGLDKIVTLLPKR